MSVRPGPVSTAGLDGWVRDRFGVTLRTAGSPIDCTLTDLVGLALRRNPRRAHLLVSTVLGKHVPVDPRVVRGMGRLLGLLIGRDALGRQVPADWGLIADAAHRTLSGSDPDALNIVLDGLPAPAADAVADEVLVFGFAETATGLGHCVAEELRPRWYLHSTRRSTDVPDALRFEEGHSHATGHLIQPEPATLLDDDGVLVLIDDELSTGATAMDAIAAWHCRRPRSRYVIGALIDLRSNADAAALEVFAAGLGCSIDVVALVRGSVDLPAGLAAAAAAYIAGRPSVALPAEPTGSWTVRVDLRWPDDLAVGGRHGIGADDRERWEAAVPLAVAPIAAALPAGAERVLVIGTEELMYLPMRLAEALGTPARRVRFQTTTRSPVHPQDAPDYPVRRSVSFLSPEQDGQAGDTPWRYLYNADWREAAERECVDDGSAVLRPDAIVLVVDTSMDRPELIGPGGLVDAIVRLGSPVVLVVAPSGRPVAAVSR